MTVYGGRSPSGPTPPAQKPDKVLLAALGFLVLAVIVGIVLGMQAFTSGSPNGTSNAEREEQRQVPQPEASSASPSPAAAPPSPTPSASPTKAAALVPAKPSLLRAAHSGMCLWVNGGEGGNAVQQPCDGNNALMLWVPQSISQDTFTIVNAQENRCLDVNGASKDPGAQVVDWSCHTGANQQWRLQRDGDGFRLVSVNSGRCVGVEGGNPNPGAPVKQFDCDGSPQQRWQFPQ